MSLTDATQNPLPGYWAGGHRDLQGGACSCGWPVQRAAKAWVAGMRCKTHWGKATQRPERPPSATYSAYLNRLESAETSCSERKTPSLFPLLSGFPHHERRRGRREEANLILQICYYALPGTRLVLQKHGFPAVSSQLPASVARAGWPKLHQPSNKPSRVLPLFNLLRARSHKNRKPATLTCFDTRLTHRFSCCLVAVLLRVRALQHTRAQSSPPAAVPPPTFGAPPGLCDAYVDGRNHNGGRKHC